MVSLTALACGLLQHFSQQQAYRTQHNNHVGGKTRAETAERTRGGGLNRTERRGDVGMRQPLRQQRQRRLRGDIRQRHKHVDRGEEDVAVLVGERRLHHAHHLRHHREGRLVPREQQRAERGQALGA